MAKFEFKNVCDKLAERDPLMVGREDDTVYRCAVLLLCAVHLGTDISILAKITGYSLSLVALVSERMQDAELWAEGQVCCEHWKQDEEYCLDLEFWMDVLVAHGSWIREPSGLGQYSYFQVGPEPSDEAVVH
jgi:hypothetical protein